MLSFSLTNSGPKIQICCDDAGISRLIDVLSKLRHNTGMTEMSKRQELEQKYLVEADRHVADVTVRIAGVRAHIADLERDGRNASALRDALGRLEVMLEHMG